MARKTPAETGYHPRCQVCNSDKRAEVEEMCSRGVGRRLVGKRFGIPHDSVGRHWTKHVPSSMKIARKTEWIAPKENLNRLVVAEQDGALTYLRRIRADLLVAFDQAKEAGHFASIASIARELRATLELTSRLTGELKAATDKSGPSAADISISREYLDLRSKLISALRRYPEAMAAVMAEFAATEAKAAEQMTAPMIEARVEEPLDAVG
jgi:hypothetical protein